MNAPAETTPANTAYLKVLEALVQINEPAERNHIARRADISPDGAGVQLVALAGKRIVVRCPQPKGAPALWSLAVSLSTARQMVDGMKRAAAEASPAADDRRRIIAAMREIGAPASAFGIAKKSGVEMPNFSLFLEEMAADGVIQRIGGTSGQRPKFALIPSVQPQTPAATDGEPGDGAPDEDHEDEETAACADPDDFRDGDDRPTVADDAYGLDYDPRVAEAEAVAYDALVEAEAAADEAPLAGEDVNSGEDVIGDWCERHADPAEAAAEQIAAAVAAGHCPTVALLIQRASPVAEEAAQRAIDDAEVEALMREEEAEIALEMARDARARGIAAAEIIRFAEQRTGLAGDADPGAVLAAIVELLDGARSAVTGMSLPA
ncbi:MAG TPA: hypothetical protein PKC26_17070 [Plasticicumulans sp.]|nr:hypothetical protein [Plasticicumulans sp.]